MKKLSTGILLYVIIISGVFASPGQAAQIARGLDDASLAAQVLLTGIDAKISLAPAMRSLLERIPVGGIMLFRRNLDMPRENVKKLLSETTALVADKTGIPPFVAVDHEGGLVQRFGPGIEKLPSAFSFWELVQKEGRDAALARAGTLYGRSAKELREMGITMVLGPVAEIRNKENGVFLETRSFGPDPDFVTAAASAYIKGMDAAGVACAVKHFPGNTAADQHSGSSVLKADKAALDEMVIPFTELIHDLSPPAMLISHVKVPALDNTPASLSRPVIEGWLRGELGFEGIALADDFSMAAVADTGLSPAAASVEALNAGIDMIMTWPRNLSGVHAAILDALKSGRLSRDRLMEAAARIIAEKIRYNLVVPKEIP